MVMNANQAAATYMQAEWRTGQIGDKLKLIQRAQKLGNTYASVYQTTDDLKEMMELFLDRELKVSFLQGFEAAIKTGIAMTEETKNYLHYEMLRNKRA